MPLKDPEKRKAYHREYMKGWYARNKTKHQAYVRRNKLERSKWFREYKATLFCTQCGENHPACLDFHHDDPSQKKYSISQMIWNSVSKQKIQEEIDKCTVLCANCHRKLHWDVV